MESQSGFQLDLLPFVVICKPCGFARDHNTLTSQYSQHAHISIFSIFSHLNILNIHTSHFKLQGQGFEVDQIPEK